MKTAARRVAAMPETIFARMTALAVEHGAVNLGQGFPDFAAPDFVKQAAVEAIAADRNQYAPGNGLVELRCAVADLYRRRYGLECDPAGEVLVTVGATEAVFAAMLGLLDPGDEVILFDPAYDSYRPAAAFAGATTRSLVLRPPDWRFDPQA
ncbi:MAG: aminotransferase class I/II-fold pyridoxal phosphate-dependent enzyme, partial [Gammaproteobacteria bacterium]